MEIELRKTAIKRYLEGEPPKLIYTELKRSKHWFFKWLKRFQSGYPSWYKDRSRAPKRRPAAISDIERNRIISTRLHLESQKFAQIGPSAIKWELTKDGCSLPSDSTIKRVLKSEGLIKKKLHTFPKELNIRILSKSLILTIFTRPIFWDPDTSKMMGDSIPLI